MGAACYVGSHAYHCNKQQTYEQGPLPVYGIGIDAVEPFERLRISALRQHLRQISQREQRCAEDGKARKQTEVAQQVGIDKQQSGKRADSGDAAEQHRLHLVAQQLLCVAHILMVYHHMEHVAHGYAQHYAAYAEGEKAELAFQPVHHGKAEQRAESNGQQQQGYGVPSAEAIQQKQKHQKECSRNGGSKVVLDLCGVVISACRCAVIAYAHIRVALGKLLNLLVHHSEHGRALSRVGRRIAWGDESDADSRVGNKEMVVNRLVCASVHQRSHLLSQHIAHTHRVHLDKLWEHLAELARHVGVVLLHLPHEMLACEQCVKARVCRRIDIGGQVRAEVVNAVGHQVVVHAVEDVADDGVLVLSHKRIDKLIAGR